MINILLDFCLQAGALMEKNRQHIRSLGNKDAGVASVVTQTDVQISDLFEQTVKKHWGNLNYLIIDEEKISRYHGDLFAKIAASEYQFVIDPIDGTVQYANGHPLYGVTVGVYKNAKPLLGLIYMPQSGELLYCDEQKVYHVQNAFSANAVKREVVPQDKAAPIIFGHAWYWRLTKQFSTEKALFFNYFSAVSQTFYTLLGDAKAYCMHLHLWDIAGVMPLADKLGLKIFEYETGKIYDAISAEYFTDDTHTQKPCVLCRPQDLDEVKQLVEPAFDKAKI